MSEHVYRTAKDAKFAKVGGMASEHAGSVVASSLAIFVSFVVKHYVRHLGPRPSAPGPLCRASSPA
jgi:hypothetical protein